MGWKNIPLEEALQNPMIAGWSDLIRRGYAACDAAGVPYTMCQVKEKFAALRMYVAFEEATPGADRALGTLRQIQAESARTCQSCGAPGARHAKPSGWVATYCAGCAAAVGARPSPAER